MAILQMFIDSVRTRTAFWIGLWVLIVINIMVIIALSRGFSLMTGLIMTGILAGGSALLTSISRIPPPEEALEPDVYHRVNSLMKEIKPVCNQIFDRNLDALLQPLETDLQREFSRGLAWLWDEVDEFYDKVDQAAQQGRAVFHRHESIPC